MLILSHILFKKFSTDERWFWTRIDYYRNTKNKTNNQGSYPPPRCPYSCLKIKASFDNSKALNFGLFKQILFLVSHLHFSLRKIRSNDLNSICLNVLTSQIDFCFPKLYFSWLIQIQVECINVLVFHFPGKDKIL